MSANWKLKSIVIFIIIAIPFIYGCSDPEVVPIDQWTWADTDKSFEEIEIVPNDTIDVILEIPEPPYEYTFRIITPKNFDEVNGNPLVLSMHGGVGGAGRTAHQYLNCLTNGLEEIEAFIISPNADRVQWYDLYNQKKVTKLIDLAIKNWPINEEKIVATGYSDGGNGTWFMAEFYPDIFSAGIAISTSYNTLTSAGKPRRINTPLYVVHSTGDELFPFEQTETWVIRTKAIGSDITFVVADSLSHFAPCDYTELFHDGVVWLQEEVWQ